MNRFFKVREGGECHYVIARNETEAVAMIETVLDYHPDDFQRRQMSVDEFHGPVTLTEDDGTKTTKPAAEWVKSEGHGYLGGSMWP